MTPPDMTAHAVGTFTVDLRPEAEFDRLFSRLSFTKRFQGDLEGASSGGMFGARTDTPGSAGYVAMERISGRLNGREGTFALQHSGTLTRGRAESSVTVVPDSGTGDLTGLYGSMTIDQSDGSHRYSFDYGFNYETE
ncbi:hypothetical protein AA23498_0314 [Acetobacter nitrogenifigens DSM 23921 = NBRC 105050]|uniref:DUF3224 domain-containing protein n=1 Tax=Acetobacter nitrogenifigens DSM 23921 = NBRC 105050 TaxID=1120919 RepID=A0A511XAY1_9PROT|nr:DUF3224 domain-containing protein [Acetobacter nitrogenifigens]GBQ88194.1 hypothetical protein AA23498_0314 [Acetobacter nitrogenifigens DSM 23921 = NBRC 105050]GEN60119.1 hypothetical protein ANI02nite_20030 [Acetobacter nitrogenifigens DSM 23921 = NBRC 105050]